jgi:hypothetical protein
VTRAPKPVLRVNRVVSALLVLIAAARGPLAAQQGAAGAPASEHALPTVSVGADTDPTKPVIFSLRDEYYDLGGGFWENAFILRADRLVLEKTELPGHAHGLLTRFDLPVASFHGTTGTTNGLGDLYAQAIALPSVRPTFLVGVGMGLTMPTATDDTLGRGKWIASPVIAPFWRFPKKGFFFVKVQDWISVAGASDRAAVHYLTVTPTFLWRFGRRWWTVLDAESTTDWERGSQTSARTGTLLGYMLSPRAGVSVKAERFFGDSRQVNWDVKTVFFVTRF